MPADFKGKIRYNPDCKKSDAEHTISCKQLGISEEGSGNVREDIAHLSELITDKIVEEFRTQPEAVLLVGYSMSLDFSIQGPVNHSLAEFGAYTATIKLPDGTEIDFDKLSKTADKVIACAKRTGKTVDQVMVEVKAELARQKKGKGTGAHP
jgi:hypothetical protein